MTCSIIGEVITCSATVQNLKDIIIGLFVAGWGIYMLLRIER